VKERNMYACEFFRVAADPYRLTSAVIQLTSAGRVGDQQQICILEFVSGNLLIFVVSERTGFVLRFGIFVTVGRADFALKIF
jgi:hypothetical protein